MMPDEDPPHLHDHRSPNDKDTFDEDPPSLHDHYSLNDEDTNAEDPPNMTFRHSWLNVGIMLPPAWEGGAAHQMPLLQLQLAKTRCQSSPSSWWWCGIKNSELRSLTGIGSRPQSDHGKRKANARVDNPSGLRMTKRRRAKRCRF
ncbi:hypothetical protein CJ030_MR2G006762 [Morella rubra]|uniref:Uncharacterized protein n=1 Tax=Morella rubra TaxID=262757 RepID=A0A6A1WGN9_9ROSI|nr:hypothetical protein CJ030_MR2G006762 [Morella rubra]